MIIGVPKEIKDKEYRISITPGGVRSLVHAGHRVIVETGAGTGSGFGDSDYVANGAEIKLKASEVFGAAEMILKVKEPLPQEYQYMRPGLLLFTYLHLAATEELSNLLVSTNVVWGILDKEWEKRNGKRV